MTEDEIYKLIQYFLKNPPVVIWGSGATIAYGLPSMNDLNDVLKSKYDFFDKANNNLEEELGKEKYQDHLSEIRKTIWSCIKEKDEIILQDILTNYNKYNGIRLLIEKFTEPHPHVFNIITTNYDRVLEDVMSINNYSYTDGFSGRLLSSYQESIFKNTSDTPFINLIKVHGSLNWFKINGETRYFNCNSKYEPKIIPPGKNKYQQAFSEPYRNLIQISDKAIKDSKSLLLVGFGFNDEHITPRITERIHKGIPIVMLTKNITPTAKGQLKFATCYLAIEENSAKKTKITYKKQSDNKEFIEIIDGSLWKLDNFMEAL